MLSANNISQIADIVKNFYETNNINPNEAIGIVPIHKVENFQSVIPETKKQNTNIKMTTNEVYESYIGYDNEDDIVYDTFCEFKYKKSQGGTYTRATLIEYAKSVGIKVLVRDDQTQIIEKIITLRIMNFRQKTQNKFEKRTEETKNYKNKNKA
jgi:hypothetical protein